MPAMLAELRRLYEHARWADEQALAALAAAGEPPAAALEVLAHVLGAEDVWLARLEQHAATLAVWPALAASELARAAGAVHAAYARYLGELGEEDLLGRVAYRNSAGQAFENTVADILLHVALHGTHHRGQVAWILRQHGLVPPGVDYIAFIRGAPTATRQRPAERGGDATC
jgi:uncharacterized damage-inducible protein DinB